ncbi:MAG: hypothetical protein M8353_10340, partial [ANME-2 cluster archaeon]|nr:hypothetical protein [ANME-2 cluster archaeon]
MNMPKNGSSNTIPDSQDDIPKNGPQTLLQLLKLLIVGMITGFRKNIPFIIGLSLLTWLVHTYLLVVVNEGFYPSNPEATSMLALEGSKLSGTLFWTLLGMISMNLFYKIRQGRLTRTIKNIGTSPRWVRQSHKQAGPIALPIILGTSALGLYFGVKLNNPLVNLQLAFILSGGIIAQRESLLTLALNLFWSDTHRLLKKPKGKFNLPGAVMGITGTTLGFILAIFLAKSAFFGFLAIILLLGLMAAFMLKQKGMIGGRALPAIIILIYACIFILIPAFADDGGWQESGGTFDQWIASEGALIAISMGLSPAVGMGLGGLLGAAAAQGAFITGSEPDIVSPQEEEGIEGEQEAEESETEKAEKEKAEKEKAEKEKAEKEKAEKEKAEKEKAEKE